MEKELIAQNTMPSEVKKVSKSEMVRFVHDVKELEVKALTLEDTAKECRKEVQRINEDHKKKKNKVEQELNSRKNDLNSLSQERKQKMASLKFWRDLLIGGIIAIIPGLILAAIVFSILVEWMPMGLDNFYYSNYDGNYLLYTNPKGAFYHDVRSIVYPLVVGIVCVITIGIVFFCKETKKKKLEKMLSDKEKQTRNRFLKIKDEWECVLREEVEANTQIARLEDYIKKLECASVEIRNHLAWLYSINIIPPRYQRFDCVSIIDDLFLNDQADSMRDATLLCDERIHWGNVEDSLRELVQTVYCVRVAMESIARDVSMMSQDVFRIAETQSEMLSEAKSTRYAAEATQQAAERTAFYEQIRYAERR